jgi:hypothetical protein
METQKYIDDIKKAVEELAKNWPSGSHESEIESSREPKVGESWSFLVDPPIYETLVSVEEI